jgi:hypothetical protein
MDHMARAVEGEELQCDQSVLATRCRICMKGGTPRALHLDMNI